MRLKVIPTKTDKKLYLVKTIKKPGAKYTTSASETFRSSRRYMMTLLRTSRKSPGGVLMRKRQEKTSRSLSIL